MKSTRSSVFKVVSLAFFQGFMAPWAAANNFHQYGSFDYHPPEVELAPEVFAKARNVTDCAAIAKAVQITAAELRPGEPLWPDDPDENKPKSRLRMNLQWNEMDQGLELLDILQESDRELAVILKQSDVDRPIFESTTHTHFDQKAQAHIIMSNTPDRIERQLLDLQGTQYPHLSDDWLDNPASVPLIEQLDPFSRSFMPERILGTLDRNLTGVHIKVLRLAAKRAKFFLPELYDAAISRMAMGSVIAESAHSKRREVFERANQERLFAMAQDHPALVRLVEPFDKAVLSLSTKVVAELFEAMKRGIKPRVTLINNLRYMAALYHHNDLWEIKTGQLHRQKVEEELVEIISQCYNLLDEPTIFSDEDLREALRMDKHFYFTFEKPLRKSPTQLGNPSNFWDVYQSSIHRNPRVEAMLKQMGYQLPPFAEAQPLNNQIRR